jgi:hypothetical protein
MEKIEMEEGALDRGARLAIARDVYENLARFLDGQSPSLASSPAVYLLREIVGDYVRRDPDGLRPLRGVIPFPEAGRIIAYRLPMRASDAKKARVVLERSLA